MRIFIKYLLCFKILCCVFIGVLFLWYALHFKIAVWAFTGGVLRTFFFLFVSYCWRHTDDNVELSLIYF